MPKENLNMLGLSGCTVVANLLNELHIKTCFADRGFFSLCQGYRASVTKGAIVKEEETLKINLLCEV